MACEIAVSRHAHVAALRFATAGVHALSLSLGEDEAWETYYTEMRDLSAQLTRLHSYLGQYEQVAQHLEVYYYHAKTVEDKMILYPSEMSSLIQYDVSKSMDRAVVMVNDLRMKPQGKIPRKPSIVYILRKYIRLRRRLKKYVTNNEGKEPLILQTPNSDVPKHRAALAIVSFASTACWNASENNLLGAFAMNAVEATLDHGFVTAFPFVLVAILSSNFGDIDLTHDLAKATLQLLPCCTAKDRPKTEALARLWCLFREPLHSHIDRTLTCHKGCVDFGDTIWGSICSMNYVFFYFQAGNLPLG